MAQELQEESKTEQQEASPAEMDTMAIDMRPRAAAGVGITVTARSSPVRTRRGWPHKNNDVDSEGNDNDDWESDSGLVSASYEHRSRLPAYASKRQRMNWNEGFALVLRANKRKQIMTRRILRDQAAREENKGDAPPVRRYNIAESLASDSQSASIPDDNLPQLQNLSLQDRRQRDRDQEAQIWKLLRE